MSDLNRVVYLTQSQYERLMGGATVGGLTKNEDTLYITDVVNNHTHGNITEDGKISASATIKANDCIIFTDSANSHKLYKGLALNGQAGKCLGGDGAWHNFNNYTHPTTDGNLHLPVKPTLSTNTEWILKLKTGSSTSTVNYTWESLNILSYLPTATNNGGKVLKLNAGANGLEWGVGGVSLANVNTSATETKYYLTGATGTSSTSLNISTSTNTEVYMYSTGHVYMTAVHNAVWNDYAEYRAADSGIAPGHVVINNDNGILSIATKRLQFGAQIISDTWGHIMGETKNAKTPIAVAGRVLVYPYQDRKNYHAGMAVCSAPNGTVDIMTREEIKNYPDCIIGIVSEIPTYETWGTNNVKVDGRIWVIVR